MRVRATTRAGARRGSGGLLRLSDVCDGQLLASGSVDRQGRQVGHLNIARDESCEVVAHRLVAEIVNTPARGSNDTRVRSRDEQLPGTLTDLWHDAIIP
ncbi:hypothetical protein pCM2_0031 (plasmid) [Clavibacter michiganensis subsp. michiganensis NCPPB 382]|uniref:Uncharacterized protein n=1 Tax=Clavibacter michiganensis subsp. michiganensis (strain NCPPB 382) TaxID=443906 RepID=A5CLP2_CLAM3|nr:hypothetical protein pCM2_0031 [Clavibacter michiganensis subsp. michiganensis NCPPB 382]